MSVIYGILGVLLFLLQSIIIIGTITRFVRCFTNQFNPTEYKSEYFSFWAKFNHSVSPFLISIIAPLGGIWLSIEASPHTQFNELFYTPLNHNHILTIAFLYVVSAIGYWFSVISGEKAPPLMRALSLLAMAQGVVLCLFLAIQLGPFSVFGFVPILITFPLLAPHLFMMLLVVELRRRFHLQVEAINKKEEDETYDSLIIHQMEEGLKSNASKHPVLFLLLIPFIALQQAILLIFGQEPTSFIKAFSETTTYTFSNHLPPPDPGGGHYLCTIASRGNKRLVKPIRKGIRDGRMIDVNRQLMIANAFEESLMWYFPLFHRGLRACYTKVARPLDKAVNYQVVSNLVFILMKPAEWFFLIWLYASDKYPENRIQRQYLCRQQSY